MPRLNGSLRLPGALPGALPAARIDQLFDQLCAHKPEEPYMAREPRVHDTEESPVTSWAPSGTSWNKQPRDSNAGQRGSSIEQLLWSRRKLRHYFELEHEIGCCYAPLPLPISTQSSRIHQVQLIISSPPPGLDSTGGSISLLIGASCNSLSMSLTTWSASILSRLPSSSTCSRTHSISPVASWLILERASASTLATGSEGGKGG
ncbi:hypothetical protein EYF80_031241 [Liparis tanakae]|uniref:Uncharacterized protein n=1 Tax=Liparis tanakae TaxID=230148 RepID=A0A4Z2GYJ2_9TELE|nr:hypothetical protein EYF80_031241 [Liparis tanakae]